MQRHIANLGDCFSELIFCLTSFSCNITNEPAAILCSSFLFACANWLVQGLYPLGDFIHTPDGMRKWVDMPPNDLHSTEIPRITQALVPISATEPLSKPNGLERTQYHLWMSLIEGLLPTVLIHPSIRVRCHTVATVWDILGRYSRWFEPSVLSSIISTMVQPVLLGIVNDPLLMLETLPGTEVTKIRLLLFCFMRSMTNNALLPHNERLVLIVANLMQPVTTCCATSKLHISHQVPLSILDAILDLSHAGDDSSWRAWCRIPPFDLTAVSQWPELLHLADARKVPTDVRNAVSEVMLTVMEHHLLPCMLQSASSSDALSFAFVLNRALRAFTAQALIYSTCQNSTQWAASTISMLMRTIEFTTTLQGPIGSVGVRHQWLLPRLLERNCV